MAELVKVRVLRTLQGDQSYQRGSTRELSATDARRLAETGAVEIVTPKAKAAKGK